MILDYFINWRDKMKKVISILLVFAMIFSLTACAQPAQAPAEAPKTETPAAETPAAPAAPAA